MPGQHRPERSLARQRFDETMAGINFGIATLSFLYYTCVGFFWVDDVWGRGKPYDSVLLVNVTGLWFVVAVAMALLLFLAAMGQSNGERWYRGAYYVYSLGSLGYLIVLWAIETALNSDTFRYPGIALSGIIVWGSYPVLLMLLLLLRRI